MTETIPKELDKFLYLDISHIYNYRHNRYSYTHEGREVLVTHEPNDLFVRYEITKVDRISKIVYSIDNEPKIFDAFVSEANGREIDHILVYFIKYNETPLYLSIFFNNGENVDENAITERRINYKLDKNGVWKKAAHFALVFNDLRELAYKHEMFQYFEIENSNKHCTKSDMPLNCPILNITGSNNGDFKYYRHTPKLEHGITSLFLYRNKLLKDIIVVNKYITYIDVYYDLKDHNNRLPLLIIIYKKDEPKEYYTNEGGNYKWKRQVDLLGHGESNSILLLTLKHLKEQLMGKITDIEIGEYFEEVKTSQTHSKGLSVLIQDHHELGYRSLSYGDEGRRFSISQLYIEGIPITFPDLPIYSVLGFYVFHHGSSTSPLFLCAVYEVNRDEIFVWYQLTKRDGNEYQICYFLSEHPRFFTNFKPIINIIETNIYNIDVELVTTLTKSYNYGKKTLTNVGDINFHVTYQKRHPTHNRYIMTPAFSNYFSINSLLVYGKVVKTVNFKSVKEIHVFEHSNMHHYKVCISTAEYNFSSESDSIKFHWYEIRKNTNRGTDWTVVGEPDIKMTPDHFNDEYNISALMDERISFYKGGKKPENKYVVPGLNIKYNTTPQVEYKAGDHWPPVGLKYPVNGSGNLYSTYEYDPDNKTIRGTTPYLPGEEGGITPLVGGLIGSGAGVGIVGVTTGYVLYSHMGTITSAITSIFH